jgi:hypothetical protein
LSAIAIEVRVAARVGTADRRAEGTLSQVPAGWDAEGSVGLPHARSSAYREQREHDLSALLSNDSIQGANHA